MYTGQADIQLYLLKDYATKVAMYPQFQQMFKQTNVPILAVWGENDPFFGPPGAAAFKRDSTKAHVHMLNTGHFVLETPQTMIIESVALTTADNRPHERRTQTFNNNTNEDDRNPFRKQCRLGGH